MIDSVANQISTIKKDVAEIKPATSNLYICYFVPVKATPFTYNVQPFAITFEALPLNEVT